MNPEQRLLTAFTNSLGENRVIWTFRYCYLRSENINYLSYNLPNEMYHKTEDQGRFYEAQQLNNTVICVYSYRPHKTCIEEDQSSYLLFYLRRGDVLSPPS